MQQEKINAYLQKLIQDEGLRQRMEKAKSPEQCLEIVKECGFDFDLDEFKELMQKVLIMAKRETGQELTDGELSLVAGGVLKDEEVVVVVGASMAVGAAFAFVAVAAAA